MEILARVVTWGSLPEEEHKHESTLDATEREPSSTDPTVGVKLSGVGDSTSEEILTPQLLEESRNEGLSELTDYELLENEKGEHENSALPAIQDDAMSVHLTRSSTSSVLMTNIIEEERSSFAAKICLLRRDSSTTISSSGSTHVDWEELERTEEEESKDETSDESTAFLLARLEQENNALATNPKAGISRAARSRSKSRPPSMQQLKKLVNEPTRPSLRYSMLPSPPPMTELEFWAALVTDYRQTAQRLPTLTSNKIRGGVPPPLRGVVWMSIAGARESFLEEEYERLSGESSPYDSLIGKDIGRSWPGVEMFRDPEGDGQQMLGRVLRTFSIYDEKIGYCQGLGFVVGPLLMHMGDKDAFCVLVRLMEHYDLRSCFLPDLYGLHLRIYQFQHLLSQHLPSLTAHLEVLQVEPLYLSQWFLSFFAVTCPLPMLLRIYDVILAEGASETLMRVALSLMRRNEKRIIGCTEFEDIMHLLLSRELWDTYGCNADDLVNDFVTLTGLVTRENLESLEKTYRAENEGTLYPLTPKPNIQAAASRFLGRFWAPSASSMKSLSPSSSLSPPSRPSTFIRRTNSKQSLTSTLNSIDTESQVGTISTDATGMSRQSSADCSALKIVLPANGTAQGMHNSKDKNLHVQIEELLTAMIELQREHGVLANELQKEREERDEDRAVVRRVVEQIKTPSALNPIPEEETGVTVPSTLVMSQDAYNHLAELVDHFMLSSGKRSSIQQTKHQLRDDAARWREQHDLETTRSAELSRQLSEQEHEMHNLREQVREARSRVQEAHKDKQRSEKIIQDLKTRKSAAVATPDSPMSPADAGDGRSPTGLREFKLGRSSSRQSQNSPQFSKRTSSLGMQALLATDDHKPPAEESVLLELVAAKTAEVVARQELEEVKSKLDSLRKMLGSLPEFSHRPNLSEPYIRRNVAGSNTGIIAVAGATLPPAVQDPPKPVAPAASTGGGFFGWGKRAVSNPATSAAA